MSSAPNSAVQPESATLNLPKPEQMLAGFPWVSAIVLYTLSWGWSLLRPNTLYWDDWHDLFQRDRWFARNFYLSTGRPPWEGVAHAILAPLGIWTITYLTFVTFFICGIFLFVIVKSLNLFSLTEINFLVLGFILVPVNHARISAIIFQYTTSYFLFFLGWAILSRSRSARSFFIACLFFFLSFKTHSFLVFYLLPLLHWLWLKRMKLTHRKKINAAQIKTLGLLLAPLCYIVLRNFYWPPTEEWASYQKPGINGLIRWFKLWFPVGCGLSIYLALRRYFSRIDARHFRGFIIVCSGMAVTALAVLPYFLIGYFKPYLSLIALRADWGTRNQLLMPLGLALSVVGLNEMFKSRIKNLVIFSVLAISLCFNTYFGSNYYLDSLKKDQIVNLFKSRSKTISGFDLVIVDKTKRFNGRGSTYRDSEWSGLLNLAQTKVASVHGDELCVQVPNGLQITLKSDTSYFDALVTSDLGLFFEVESCNSIVGS